MLKSPQAAKPGVVLYVCFFVFCVVFFGLFSLNLLIVFFFFFFFSGLFFSFGAVVGCMILLDHFSGWRCFEIFIVKSKVVLSCVWARS